LYHIFLTDAIQTKGVHTYLSGVSGIGTIPFTHGFSSFELAAVLPEPKKSGPQPEIEEKSAAP